MGFMKPQVYKAGYFQVDTTAGVETVPDFAIGRTMSTHIEALLDYLEGDPLDSDSTVEHQEGYVCRMRAPGYLDCTAWAAFDTPAECDDYLQDMYGDDGEVN